MKRRNFLKMFGLAIPAVAVSAKIAEAIPDVTSTPILESDVQSGILTPEEALIPEVWAEESLHVLEENTIAGNLIHRDFDSKPYVFQRGIHRLNGNIRLALIQENSLDSYVVLFRDCQITIAGDDITMHLIQESPIPNVDVHNLFKNAVKLIIGGDTVCIGIPEFRWGAIESNLRTMEFTVSGKVPRVDIL